MKYLRLVACVIIFAVMVVWLILMFSGDTKLRDDSANGRYANACCGTIRLHDGVMTLGDRRDGGRYSIGSDKFGPYVLPLAFVGIGEGHRFRVDKKAPPRKLRLDSGTKPVTIELTDVDRSTSHVFVRTAPERR
jgi:hypothetical protein